MALVRELNISDNSLTYLGTIALFCAIPCTILMLKFRGFKASIDLSSSKRSTKGHYDLAPQVSVSGAYRTSRDESFVNNNYLNPRKRITPSMVQLPPQTHHSNVINVKPSKSTGDLSRVSNVSVELRKSTPNVAGPSAAQISKEAKRQAKEQKRLEKQRLVEMKKTEKLAAQEREKQEKLRKEREKQAAQQQAKEAKENQKKKKAAAPQPQKAAVKRNNIPTPPPFQTMAPTSQPKANPLSQRPVPYSTNTLESSISRSTGPPPYADNSEVVPNKKNDTGNNIQFGKRIEASSSWDLISEHRQQINRTPGITNNKSNQKHLDLNFNGGNSSKSEDRDNSEA